MALACIGNMWPDTSWIHREVRFFFFLWIHPAPHFGRLWSSRHEGDWVATCCASFLQDAPPHGAPMASSSGSSSNLVPGPPPLIPALGCAMRRHPSAKRCFNSRVRNLRGREVYCKTFLLQFFKGCSGKGTHISLVICDLVPKLMHFQKWWPCQY